MFWFAPLMGATITAIIYEYAPLKPKKRDNKEDMTNTLFQADEVREEYEDEDDEEEEAEAAAGGRTSEVSSAAAGEQEGGAEDDLMDDI